MSALLGREGLVMYRALRRRLDGDYSFFDELPEELLFDEDGKGLAWIRWLRIVKAAALADHSGTRWN